MGINRIRLEFKARTSLEPSAEASLVLIESDWNLKKIIEAIVSVWTALY